MAALAPADLERFFAALAERLPGPAKLILTGGAEALLLGSTRPTRDIDFGLVVPRGGSWSAKLETIVADAARSARVAIQYSEDIDRWSPVAIPERLFKTRPLRRFGRLSVHLLEPACWAVYKLARYYEADIADLVAVLRNESISSLRVARLCGESLRASPRSTALFAFRKQVEHFFREHGRKIWGPGFDGQRAILAFHRAARISSA